MNKKDLTMTIVKLVDHCNEHSDCSGCELRIENNKCMLRHLPLPETFIKLTVSKKNQVVWIKFEDKEKVLEALEDIKEVTRTHSGYNTIQLYAEKENSIKELGNYYLINEEGSTVLSQKYGSDNVKIVETEKGA